MRMRIGGNNSAKGLTCQMSDCYKINLSLDSLHVCFNYLKQGYPNFLGGGPHLSDTVRNWKNDLNFKFVYIYITETDQEDSKA